MKKSIVLNTVVLISSYIILPTVAIAESNQQNTTDSSNQNQITTSSDISQVDNKDIVSSEKDNNTLEESTKQDSMKDTTESTEESNEISEGEENSLGKNKIDNGEAKVFSTPKKSSINDIKDWVTLDTNFGNKKDDTSQVIINLTTKVSNTPINFIPKGTKITCHLSNELISYPALALVPESNPFVNLEKDEQSSTFSLIFKTDYNMAAETTFVLNTIATNTTSNEKSGDLTASIEDTTGQSIAIPVTNPTLVINPIQYKIPFVNPYWVWDTGGTFIGQNQNQVGIYKKGSKQFKFVTTINHFRNHIAGTYDVEFQAGSLQTPDWSSLKIKYADTGKDVPSSEYTILSQTSNTLKLRLPNSLTSNTKLFIYYDTTPKTEDVDTIFENTFTVYSSRTGKVDDSMGGSQLLRTKFQGRRDYVSSTPVLDGDNLEYWYGEPVDVLRDFWGGDVNDGDYDFSNPEVRKRLSVEVRTQNGQVIPLNEVEKGMLSPGTYVMTYRMTNIMGFQSLPFTRNLVIKGRLTWTTPTSMSFGTHKLEKLERIYPVEVIEGSPLEVIDSRGNGSSWTVTAKLKEEFKNKSSKVAKNILFYKNLNGEEAITNSSAVLVAKNTVVNNQYKTTISNQWNQDNGLYVKTSPGSVQKGDYTGTIEWTLNDTP
ncbi:hypothetical protein PSN82_002616 [Enterococcus faecalis]|nr:hypothetical protein [Enterococcus faecalis]